jgi:hypothetical protein
MTLTEQRMTGSIPTACRLCGYSHPTGRLNCAGWSRRTQRQPIQALALRLLNEWDVEVGKFWHVVPSEIIPLLAAPLTDAADAAGGAQIA